jgi:pimeloyl-ACP methyl ester carboxylesterase
MLFAEHLVACFWEDSMPKSNTRLQHSEALVVPEDLAVRTNGSGFLVWDCYRPPPTYNGARSALPIILVHGAGHSAAIYTQWGPHLARLGCTVYALDLRGHGRSRMPANIPVTHAHLWQYADDITTLVETEGIAPGQFVLVGHSMGGAVVQVYARNHPVAGLVILASTALPRFMLAFLAFMRHAPILYLFAMLRGPTALFDTPRHIQRFLLTPEDDTVTVQRIQAQLGEETKHMASECIAWMRQGYRPLHTARVLVLGGSRDVFFPPVELQRTTRFYAPLGARTQVIPGAPHDLMVSWNWQLGADAVMAFARACSAAEVPTG